MVFTKKTNRLGITFLMQIICIACIGISGLLWSNSLVRNLSEFFEPSYYNFNDTNNSIIEISTTEEWISFAESVNNGKDYADISIYLTKDLDFTNCTCNPTGSENNPFRGTLYGKGHVLENVKITSSDRYVGLFGYTQNATITGVTLNNCEISSDSASGTGGFVGFTFSGVISECSFNGKVSAEEGSVGGIAGSNWSTIERCYTYGEVTGPGGISAYGNNYLCGTGGIAGDNQYAISLCQNHATIDAGSLNESGGVSGCNNSFIQGCSNFGNVAGGGIVEINQGNAEIQGCFNLGNVYAGIAKDSYQNSTIKQCANFGVAEGLFAGDIVSFWGVGDTENCYGKISQCLYVNTSRAGVVRKNSLGKSTLHDNYKISDLSNDNMGILFTYLNANDYADAFRFVIQKETYRRHCLVWGGLSVLSIVVLSINGSWLLSRYGKKKRKYSQGKRDFELGEYLRAFELLSEIVDYKDCEALAKKALTEHLRDCRQSGVYTLGRIGKNALQWKYMQEEEGNLVLLAQYALTVECINSEGGPVEWERSELYARLNSYYKTIWFNKRIRELLSIKISLLTVNEAISFLTNSEERRCKPIQKFPKVLMNGGNAYWWLRSEENEEVMKMPFVTADGLVSEKGKSITTNNIAVRPIITVRMSYEDNS